MKIRTILIPLIVLCVLLAGCETYDYSKGKEIPISVAEEDKDDVDDFKSEFEKLQKLIEEGESAEEEGKEVEEELVEVVKEEEVVIVEKKPEEKIVKEEVELVEITEEEAEVVEAEEEEIPKGVPTIKVNEGELVNLAIKSEDADDDTITYTFTEPLDKDGKWQTDFGDAGKYKVTITASDGELSTSQDAYIIVEKVSRAPKIEDFEDITVDENETIELKPKITDPEGGSVSLEYSGWMTKSTKYVPFDVVGTGETAKKEVTLKATSSESGESTTKTITITIENTNRRVKIISIINKGE